MSTLKIINAIIFQSLLINVQTIYPTEMKRLIWNIIGELKRIIIVKLNIRA
jgi:hypothetical protein